MAFLDEFGKLMGEEAAETAIHDMVARYMRRAADNGESGKDVARAGLVSVFDSEGTLMRTASRIHGFIPGIAYPIIATALAAAMKHSKFFDRLLPDDNRTAVKEAKFILRNITPHLIIGLGEGMRDSASIRSKVGHVLDQVRSTTEITPDNAQNKVLDTVVKTPLLPFRIFIPARDSDGNIRYGADGVLVVTDPVWVLAKSIWDQTHKTTTRLVPQRGNQPSRTEVIKAEPFPCELMCTQDAIASTEIVAAGDVEAIKAMLRKPGSWGSTLSPEATALLIALSITRSRKGPIEQGLAEDFFKDIPGKCDNALLEALARRFHGSIGPDGTLSDNDFDAIVAFMDDWLGAELTPWSKIKRSAARAWRNRGTVTVSGRAKAGFYTVVVLVFLAIVSIIGLFCYSVSAVFRGFIVNLADPMTVFGSTFSDPAIPAACMLIGGSLTIFVLLHFLYPVQDFINAVTFWVPKPNKDSLIKFKQRFGYMFVVPVTTGLGLALFHASGISRLVVAGLALLSVLKMEGYKSYDAPHIARWTGIKNVATGSVLILTAYFIDWLLRAIPWGTIVMASVPFFQNAHLSTLARAIVSILAGVVALTLGCLFILFLGKISNSKKEMSKFWYVMAFAMACVIGYLTWNGFVASEPSIASSGADTGSTVSVQAAEVTVGTGAAQVRQDINPPIIRTSIRMMRGRPDLAEPSRKGNGHFGHSHTTGLDCSQLSFEGQQAAGCP